MKLQDILNQAFFIIYFQSFEEFNDFKNYMENTYQKIWNIQITGNINFPTYISYSLTPSEDKEDSKREVIEREAFFIQPHLLQNYFKYEKCVIPPKIYYMSKFEEIKSFLNIFSESVLMDLLGLSDLE